ncbi:chorismate-binding protein [Algivirga pacifica]|uniref:isochorismate synthase n=1 Tax=Algivirga pacifica TaxID=1162670 RepID=A0ABP9DEZ6_9BACT
MKPHLQELKYKGELSDHLFLTAMLEFSADQGLPVAFWNKPNQAEIEGVIGEQLHYLQADIEELKEGFVLGAFDSEERQCHYIPADVVFSTKDFEIRENNSALQVISYVQSVIDQQQKEAENLAHYHVGDNKVVQVTKEGFEGVVQKGINSIQKGYFKKVVLSRTKAVNLPPQFDVINTYLKLTKAYPTAFVSLISVPEVGTWLGATPETLIQVDAEGIFKTIALAGTQPVEEGVVAAEARWAQKEIEEQAMVSRYIINCFKKIRVREYEESGPKTVQAGHLFHLGTDFEVDMKGVRYPQLSTVMLELLHPTSAVCGMPKEESMAFILAEEGYDRSIYSGYIGPVNQRGKETHLFVNLRCMQVFREQAILYAGAGITSDSVPSKEWKETELKMDTMLRFLSKS